MLAWCWLLFATSPARAQSECDDPDTAIHEPCPTATANEWQPLFPSATPAPTQNYDCGEGYPEGYGLVTPSVHWTVNCGQCLQQAKATATAQALPSTTAAVATPTPSSTSPPITTSQSAAQGYFYVQVEQSYQTEIAAGNCEFWRWCNHYQQPISLDCGEGNSFEGLIGSNAVTATRGSWNMSLLGYGSATQNIGVQVLAREPGYVRPECDLRHDLLGELSGLAPEFFQCARNITWGQQYAAGTTIASRGDTGLLASWTISGYLCYGSPPEPPSPAGYCSSIVPEEQEGSQYGMALPQIMVGPASCLQLGGQSLDLAVLNLLPGLKGLTSIEIPGIEVCARAISFGGLNLFGLQFDMDLFATLLALAGLLRMLLRS